MPLSGTYYYPGQYTPPAAGSGQPGVGRGPIDVYIAGGIVAITATLEPTDGTTNIELVSLSGTIVRNSSSFSGSSYTVLLPATDVSKFSNLAITLVNHHPTNRLESGSVEFSPDNSAWETDWDTETFAGLAAAGTVRSMQIFGNSRRYVRVRGIPSGSAGALTGSIDAYLHTNNG